MLGRAYIKTGSLERYIKNVLKFFFMKSQNGQIGLVGLKDSSIDKYVIGPGVRGLNKSPQ